MDQKILEINNLTVTIGKKKVINDVSLDLYQDRITVLVGESGSGKTLTALSILDLLPGTALRESGEIVFKEKNIFDMDYEEKRKIRGNDISMVFQEPFTSLNPVMRVGDQISEVLRVHKDLSKNQAAERINELLELVKLSADIVSRYPHELSGGMRQRIVIAMALVCDDPDILLLDEPTTALDVSIQKQILDLIKQVQEKEHFGVLFVTHDFSVVNMIADEICVMRQGSIVEKGTKEEILQTPKHEYTKHLISCVPKLGDKRKRLPIDGLTS